MKRYKKGAAKCQDHQRNPIAFDGSEFKEIESWQNSSTNSDRNSFSVGTIPGFTFSIDNEFSAVLMKGRGSVAKRKRKKRNPSIGDEGNKEVNNDEGNKIDNKKGGKKMSSEKQYKKNSCDYLYYKWLIENGKTTTGRNGAPGAPGASGDPFHDLKKVLRRLLGKTVTISTDFAPVTGILSAIEDDYVVITEAAGSVVLVPLSAHNSVREPI
ncbi:hypothetical protein ACQKKK_10590 [Peribacillus sp. NPDC006672]|uniref:hypothetical protein n=1 Tax=Peribacillus sp. NPDC006672 TaxID=3390606 RepID=UPI003D03EC6B